MLRIDSAQWFGPGLVEPVLGATHQDVDPVLTEFGQFSDAPITATARPLVGWAEPYAVELFQGDDRAVYLARMRDVAALIEAGILTSVVLASIYSWSTGRLSFRVESIHTSGVEADLAAIALRAAAGDGVAYHAYPASHYIPRKAIEACGRWTDVPSRPSYDDLDDRYQVWYQHGGQGPHAGEYLVTSRTTIEAAQDALRAIAEKKSAALNADGLMAHREPATGVPYGTRWFVVDRDDPNGIGAGLLWVGNPEGC